ncbi:MAG TPA: hypothetical protein VGX71_05510 [Pseudaminobacter sp.]|nr:hypothetical protein [Pseudaminobacter sp.]
MILRAFNWLGYSTVGVVSFFLGICAAELTARSDLDEALASLFGAALGAAITVIGTVWVARHQSSQGQRSFLKLIADSTGAIRDEAYLLVCLAEQEVKPNLKDYGSQLAKQIERLRETFNLFERNMNIGSVDNYEARLWIFRLENTIQKNLRVFEKEANWLTTPTKNVIENSKGDLAEAASRIFEGCVGALRELGFDPPLPDDKEVSKRLGFLLP